MAELALFEGFGVEMEYMIVDRDTLAVKPLADQLLRDLNGEVVAELEVGAMAWCNELVSHVIEIKTNGPASSLDGLEELFQQEVQKINGLLAAHNACLMPTAMHPMMNPDAETVLWEHEYNEIYATFNRIFDCRGHGWSNLQSTHLNLPFSGDDEFGRLHAAIRALLPIIPVLSASSPLMDGEITGLNDTRLDVYKNNARAVPLVSGNVVPEAVFSIADYQNILLPSIYKAIAPHDPEGILQEEWLNARGAIARFDRNAIEIRVLDIQECPAMDIAILQAIRSVLMYLVYSETQMQKLLRELDTRKLAAILDEVIKHGGSAEIDYPEYLSAFGCDSVTAREVWECLLSQASHAGYEVEERYRERIQFLLKEGNLSARIVKALGTKADDKQVHDVYLRLISCLRTGEPFTG